MAIPGHSAFLFSEGFYSSRTDFIRTAIRNQLGQHAEALKQTIIRRTMAIGAVTYTRAELEQRKAAGVQLEIKVVGALQISNDVPPQLAQEAIKSVEVHGVFRAPEAVKEALKDRIK